MDWETDYRKRIKSSFLVAIVGGIGAGKTTVCKIFEDLGATVIDADQIARNTCTYPTIKQKILDLFGEIIKTNGEIDRRKLAQIVFADREALSRLEQVVIPEVDRIIAWQILKIEEAQHDPRSPLPNQLPLIVLDIPVLEKSCFRHLTHQIIFIDAAWEERLGRVQQNRGWTEADLRVREQEQIPVEWKARIADDFISNYDPIDPDFLLSQCQQLLDGWIEDVQHIPANNS